MLITAHALIADAGNLLLLWGTTETGDRVTFAVDRTGWEVVNAIAAGLGPVCDIQPGQVVYSSRAA